MAQKRPGENDGKRRGGGLRALAASLPKATRKAMGKRGLGEGGLIADWPSIVGADLAAVCTPNKLTRGGEATLTLRVESGHALTLQHLEQLLIERINGYLGYGAVARLRLQQGPLTRNRKPAAPPPTPLSPAEEAELTARTASVADDELRAALERLARAVHQGGADNGDAEL